MTTVNGGQNELLVGGVAHGGAWVHSGAELSFVGRRFTIGHDLVASSDGVVQILALNWTCNLVCVVFTAHDTSLIVRIDVDAGPVSAKWRDLFAVGDD